MAQLVRELNPKGKIFVMESSAFQQTRPTMLALNYTKVNHLANLSAYGCADATLLRIKGDLVHTIRKDFELLGGRGRESKLGWTGHPQMQIESALIKDTKLQLCVKPKPNHIHMLEVLVDGKRLEEAIIGGFANVVLDIGAQAQTAREVMVRGYDRYLHYAEQTATIKST